MFAKDLDGIAKRLLVLLVLLISTEAVSYATDDQESNATSALKRITIENFSGFPLVGEDPIVFMTSNNYYAVIRLDYELLRNLSKGEYDVVINRLQKVLKENAAWWKNSNIKQWDLTPKNPYCLTQYARLLATAYELKGDYDNAMRAYATAYGETSDEYRWAELRFLYAQGEKSKTVFFERFSQLMNEEGWISVDKVCSNLKKSTEMKLVHDPLAVTLWKLRFNCARVVCPEILFVSNLNWRTNPPRGWNFYDLQRESYKKFVDFVKENWSDETSESYRVSNNPKAKLELLRDLKALPYRIH